MQLETYQHNALDQLDRWLDDLKDFALYLEKSRALSWQEQVSELLDEKYQRR